MASLDNISLPQLSFTDLLERITWPQKPWMISWAFPPTINPKWLVHNIVPPSNEASIGPINVKCLLQTFPPLTLNGKFRQYIPGPINFTDLLERIAWPQKLWMISWALPPPINPKWLVHNIVPPSNEASIGPIKVKCLLQSFPPLTLNGKFRQYIPGAINFTDLLERIAWPQKLWMISWALPPPINPKWLVQTISLPQ